MQTETIELDEQYRPISKEANNEFEIIDNFDHYIGKLFVLNEGTLANFEDDGKTYLFEKIGFWKNIVEIRLHQNHEIIYSISCNGHTNSSEIKLNNGTEIMLKHGEVFGNYWEWKEKISMESIFGYTLVPDFENVISVQLLTKKNLSKELNLICALGFFLLLKF